PQASHGRRDVDDGAAALLEHVRHRRLGQHEGGGDVEVERALEVPGARVEERTGHRAAGVVDDHVDATERIRAAVDERCDGVVVVDVDRHGDGAAAEAVDLLRHRL